MHCWYLEARRTAAAKSVHIIHAQGPHNMCCKGLVLEAAAKMPMPNAKGACVDQLGMAGFLKFYGGCSWQGEGAGNNERKKEEDEGGAKGKKKTKGTGREKRKRGRGEGKGGEGRGRRKGEREGTG